MVPPTTDQGVQLTLPLTWWRGTKRRPRTAAQERERIAEALIGLYSFTDEGFYLDVLHRVICPQMGHGEFWLRVEQLCALSADAADARAHSPYEVEQVATDEYHAALAGLVSRE